ncbi:hypothetical protein [Haloarchaeobius sp. DFWS5]|uniref:hypothetical protein n=1 Tax=Haloarchaeobius sp. DFWS5 TaxID=3446114 RepID=UPI003EBF18BF
MNSIRSSRWAILAVVALFAVAAVGTATAVTITNEDVPEEKQVGEQYTATVTLSELYKNPSYTNWTLQGETELQDVTWTVVTEDTDTGSQIDQQSFDGQSFNYTKIDAEKTDTNQVTVKVTGTVPEVTNYTYADEEQFVVASLTQVRDGGTTNDIGTTTAHHFTSESQSAREALNSAKESIDSAESSGASVSDAQSSFDSAVSAYENGNFENAQTLANRASEEAGSSADSKAANESRNQLIMYGAAALVALLLVGGGIYWYSQQGDDYSRLG